VKLAEEGWNRLQEPERGRVIHSLVKRGRGGQEPAAGGKQIAVSFNSRIQFNACRMLLFC